MAADVSTRSRNQETQSMSGPSFGRSAGTISGLVLIAVLAGACASSASPVPAGASPTPAGASPAASAAEASISVSPSSAPTAQSNNPPLIGIFVTSLGTVLEVGNGRVLYVHAGDSATASTCLDACATAWPPLTIAAGTTIVAPPGAKGAFASISRPDGSVQLTYRAKPLYFWQKDVNPGDTTGQGINGFTVATP
jgi:predicted lipoprotein with Yx(FWY)xxD motif